MTHRKDSLRLALLLALAAAEPAEALQIFTSADVRYQTIQGWGTSGGSPAMNSTAWRNAYRDLGLNIYRVQLSHEVLTPARTDYDGDGVLESGEADYRVRIPLAGNTMEENVGKFDFSLHAGETRSGNFARWLRTNAKQDVKPNLSC